MNDSMTYPGNNSRDRSTGASATTRPTRTQSQFLLTRRCPSIASRSIISAAIHQVIAQPISSGRYLLAASLFCAPVLAQAMPASFNLSDLNGSNGFVINGIDASDYSGFSVSNAGDINGDGVDDLIIGAHLADPNGDNAAGESYVVFGSSGVGSGGTINLSTLIGSKGFVINGIDASDNSGVAVSSAGDINGDGVDDLIIGALFADPNGNSNAGESYVVFGGSGVGSGGVINLSALIGSKGFLINGIDASDYSGRSVSSAGDINGDGVDDLIIGAPYADPNGKSSAGESYVVFGGSGLGSFGSINLSALNGSNGFVINGIDADDRSGRSISSAGDINGDGVDDLIIGALFADPNGNSNAGESYVVFLVAAVSAAVARSTSQRSLAVTAL